MRIRHLALGVLVCILTACPTSSPPSAVTLTVSKTGSGTIGSNPAGIDCGSTCSTSYAAGTAVVLTATPATGSSFAGWGGACSGAGSCALTVNQNQSVTASFSSSASPTPPVVLIASPTNGASFSDASLSIIGTVADRVGVTKLEYSLNGGSRQTLTASSAFNFTVASAVGNNNVQVFAENASGLKDSALVSFSYTPGSPQIDNPPVVTITSPSSGTTNSSVVNVNGTVSDDKGIRSLQYRLNGGARQNLPTSASFNFSVTLIEGANTVEVFATDTKTQETPASLNLTYTPTSTLDTTPDPFSFASQTNRPRSILIESNPIRITGISAPSPTSIGGGEYATSSDDVTYSAWTGASGSVANGTYIKLRVQTSANYSSATTATLTVGGVSGAFTATTGSQDSAPPTVTITSPANNASTDASSITVTGSADDNVGVAQLEYRVNGGPRQSLPGTGSFSFSSALSVGSTLIEVFARDAAGNEGQAQLNVTRNGGGFTLSPVYAPGGNAYIIAQGADALYELNLNPISPFNTPANGLQFITPSGGIVGTGANQVSFTYRTDLSSSARAAIVIRAGASAAVGDYQVTLSSRGGGVDGNPAVVNLKVVPCSGGCS